MKEELKLFAIEEIEKYREDENPEFAYAKIWFLSDKSNSHKNPISLEVLKRDAPTILGKFLVGKWNNWKKDLESHNPDQSIIGYFDPRGEVTFEEKDGKTFAVAEATISKLYANKVYEAFKENNGRSVSVEMTCTEGETDEFGETPILSFNLTGCTILGLDISPSCKGAEMTIKQFAESISESPLKKFANKRKKGNKESDKEMKAKTKEFAVDITDLWGTVYGLLCEKHPHSDWGCEYRIEGIYEEDNVKFAVLKERDKDTLYKAVLHVEEDGIHLDDELVEVDQVFIEKEGVKKFEEPEDSKKFKEFEDEEEKKEKDDQDAENDDEKEEDDEEEKEEEKQFSLDVNIDQAAYLQMLESETEGYKTLINELWEAKDYNLVMGKALEMSKKLADVEKELSELKQFKAEQEDKAKQLAVEKQLSEVKGDLTPEQIKEFQESAKEYTIDTLSIWSNGVKAFAYENSKGKSNKKKDFTRIGENKSFGERTNTPLTPEDVFQKYLG